MTAKTQVAEAIRELKKFQEVRSKSETDDSDELLNQAKLKEGELTAAAAAAAPPPPAPPAWMRPVIVTSARVITPRRRRRPAAAA